MCREVFLFLFPCFGNNKGRVVGLGRSFHFSFGIFVLED